MDNRREMMEHKVVGGTLAARGWPASGPENVTSITSPIGNMADLSPPIEPPSAQQYADAFQHISPLSKTRVEMLNAHYTAPQQTITATKLATAMGFTRHSTANVQYGRLGRLVGEALEYNPTEERLGTLVTFEQRNNKWHWLMRPQVAEALELLGWVAIDGFAAPDMETAGIAFVEGSLCRITVNAYERKAPARAACIAQYGTRCFVCGFDFGEVYGREAEGFIHVHHLRPLSEIGQEYVVDPVMDMRPVCANCHAVIHLGGGCRTIEEMQQMLQERYKKKGRESYWV